MRSTKLPKFNRGALRISKRQERASVKWKDSGVDEVQDLTSHDKGPRTSKSWCPSEEPDSKILKGYCELKEFGHLGPLYTKPKAHAKEEETPEDEWKSPNCQTASPRTISSLANRDYKGEERHAIKGKLAEHPKKQDKYWRSTMRAWWRSNSRRNCYLHIKYLQLTFWPH